MFLVFSWYPHLDLHKRSELNKGNELLNIDKPRFHFLFGYSQA